MSASIANMESKLRYYVDFWGLPVDMPSLGDFTIGGHECPVLGGIVGGSVNKEGYEDALRAELTRIEDIHEADQRKAARSAMRSRRLLAAGFSGRR